MQKVKLRGCNCKSCRTMRSKNRNMDKLITKLANKAIRQENKKLCSDDTHVFNVSKLSYYFA